MSEFEDRFENPGEVEASAIPAAGGASPGAWGAAAGDDVADSPVMAAMRELDGIGDRELAEHPDVYQRIHTELQAALTTIDDA